MGTVPASAREALDMVRAGLGYLAAADAAQLPAATQAECLRELEQARRDGDGGAGRIPGRVHRRAGPRRGRGLQRGVLAMHRTGITRGAAVAHTAWAKRTARIRGCWRRWPRGRSPSQWAD